jgi:hypothetical protein
MDFFFKFGEVIKSQTDLEILTKVLLIGELGS